MKQINTAVINLNIFNLVQNFADANFDLCQYDCSHASTRFIFTDSLKNRLSSDEWRVFDQVDEWSLSELGGFKQVLHI